MRQNIAILFATLGLWGPLSAQTNRERAVAIDRIEAPAEQIPIIDGIGPELHLPWSLALLPGGSFLVTEKHRGIKLISADGRATALTGSLPTNVLALEDSGYLDIMLDPGFAQNRLIYLAYVEGSAQSNRTAIWKARLDGDRLVAGRTIFRANTPKKAPSHPGGRMLFLPDGTLLLSIGDGYDYRDQAQDPASHLGKLLRLDTNGVAPADNPFIGKPGYAPELWTIGHRNIQGLSRDTATGLVWAHEHGPRGGDEINLIEPGNNYGWPKALFGIDYDGKRISDSLHSEGITDPSFFWAPSIAPSGLAIYHGSAFPEWEGKWLVGALAARGMILLRRGKESGLLFEEARLLTPFKWRIRDVRVSGDGSIYLLTDDERGRLLRLTPKPKTSETIPPDHPLAELAFLVGEWKGESLFRPLKDGGKREIAETSTLNCAYILANSHIRCATRFVRSDGRSRVVEHSYSQGTKDRPILANVISDRWTGSSRNEFVRQPEGGAFVAELPFEEEGRPYIERITITPSTDRNSITHIEESRPGDGGIWFETFRWNLSRISP